MKNIKKTIYLSITLFAILPSISQSFFWGGSAPSTNKNTPPKTTIWDKIEANIKREQEELEKAETYEKLEQELASKRRVLESQQQSIRNKILSEILLHTSNIIEQSLRTIDEIKTIRQQTHIALQNHDQKVKDVIADPAFSLFQYQIKTAPTYKDIEEATQNNTRIENQIQEKEQLKNALSSDIYKKKTTINALNDDIKAKKNERDTIANLANNQRILQGELIDQDLQLLTLKKTKEEFFIKELITRQRLFETEIEILKKQLEFARVYYETIKKQLVIDRTYLENAKKTFNEARHALSNDLTTMTHLINGISEQKSRLDEEIKRRISKEGLAVGETTPIHDWNISPKTQKEWERFIPLGLLFEQGALLDLDLLINPNRN